MNLSKVYKRFPTKESCLAHIEVVRWQGKPVCPYCKSDKTSRLPKERRHHCNSCNTSFSATVGTIFHHTHLDLQKWFLAVAIILNAKKGLSARQLGRDLDVNKDTAWRIAMQIRSAMATDQRTLIQGIVDDGTFIGDKSLKGDPGSGGKTAATRVRQGRGTNKTPVVGMLQREGNVIAKVVREGQQCSRSLSALDREYADASAVLTTDEIGCIYRYNNRKNPEVFNNTICRALGVHQ